jgi:hypothetical protein
MSWLNGALTGLGFGYIILVFYVVGLVAFLLPPVPGLPVAFVVVVVVVIIIIIVVVAFY